ncbi:DUF4252 domain-containing protein [Bizionia sediminis]|uniref:DUF4252 domain-containing protein n=1 Tax=Bizionia sediminis TaxID=1737064 RepID=A0ABW5KRY2_9FLAO
MRLLFRYVFYCTLVILLATSCNSEETLQTYFVNNQETPHFITADVPTATIIADESILTPAQAAAFKTVRHLNFLGFNLNDTNKATYHAELEKVKTLLEHDKYQELLTFNDSGNTVTLKYVGTETKADEVIVLANSDRMGFGIIRILGSHMRPEDIGLLVAGFQNNQVENIAQLNTILNFFK